MSAETRDDFSAEHASLYGVQLVEAGAGTGKTHAIVELFVRFLLERQLDVSQILIVTYTVAATAELRRRIRSRLVELARDPAQDEASRGRLLEALRGFDGAAIFTIHGFCQRVLRERAFESGSSFESELVSDVDGLLEEVSQDFWVRELCDASAIWTGYLTAAGWWPSRLATLAASVAARPDLTLRPARRESSDLDAAEAKRCEVHRALARAWSAGGELALQRLARAAEEGDLGKTWYAQAKLEPQRTAMQREMASEEGERGILQREKNFPWLGQSHIRRRTRKNGTTPEDPIFGLCDDLVDAERALDDALEDGLVAFLHDFVAYATTELARRKRERDVLFFDDLLLQLSGALGGEGGDALAVAVRQRYPVALIDEFQDTDPVQYDVFHRIWQRGDDPTLFLIGDPKQAIYGFRGADVFAYLSARHGAGAVHTLARNWRSDPALLDGLNALFAVSEGDAGTRPFVFEEIEFEPATPRPDAENVLVGERIASGLRVLMLEADEGVPLGGPWLSTRLAAAVAAEVARVLVSGHEIDGRPLVAGDIAVLTRTNRQARDMQVALRDHGIAAVLQSEESVFETDEVAELERVLRAIADPEDPARVRAAVATTLLSNSSDEGIGLPGAEVDDSAAWEAWGGCLRDCRRLWLMHGLPRALRHLWTERGVAERLLARADGERRVTNLHHAIELLHQEATEARLGPLSLLYWLGRRRADARAPGRWVAEEAQLRLESDDDAVQLLTIHRAKGLQFPVTICPSLWDGTLLRKTDDFLRFHDDGSELVVAPRKLAPAESIAQAQLEAFAENLRVAYVALTRARHHCSLVWGLFPRAGAATSPLRHFVSPDGAGVPSSKIDEAGMRAAFEAVAASSQGGLRVELLDKTPGPRVPTRTAHEQLASTFESRVASRSFRGWWRVSSFSGLVAFADDAQQSLGAAVGPNAEEGRDYDEHTGAIDLAVRSRVPVTEAESEVRLAGFPAGAMPGILIHEIFEEIDFEEPVELESLVATKLRGRSLSPVWASPLAESIRDVLAVPLQAKDPSSALGCLPRSQRLDEMPFTIPVGAGAGAGEALTPTELASVFEAHAGNEMVQEYARRAAALGFTPLAGYLRGFVDIVFRHGGRWYLADYKSNHLGAHARDYTQQAMVRCMLEHDYVLQYHLYLVALHRHLQQRLPNYDYDAHLGGAYYLFVRGMAPGHPPGSGVLFDRPPRALIEGLSEVLS